MLRLSFLFLVRCQPVLAGAHSYLHGYAQGQRVFHEFFNFRFDNLQFIFGRIKHQFVVYLQDHAGLQLFSFQPVMNVDHGNFDDIGGSALNRRVNSVALGITPDVSVA